MFTWNSLEEGREKMGFKKSLSDVSVIGRIYYLQFRDELGRYLFSGFFIPVGAFLVASTATGKDLPNRLRFFTASFLLSFSMLTIMWLGSILIEDRFYGRIKLFITAPVSPASYVLGILFYAYILGLITSLGFLLTAYLFSIPVQPQFLPLLLLIIVTLSTFTGIGIAVSQYAKSLQAGGVLADSTSMILIFLSPVYYPIEILPKGMQYLAYLLPTTYAADGFAKGLSGKDGIGIDLLVLTFMSLLTLAIAIRMVHWREV